MPLAPDPITMAGVLAVPSLQGFLRDTYTRAVSRQETEQNQNPQPTCSERQEGFLCSEDHQLVNHKNLQYPKLCKSYTLFEKKMCNVYGEMLQSFA